MTSSRAVCASTWFLLAVFPSLCFATAGYVPTPEEFKLLVQKLEKVTQESQAMKQEMLSLKKQVKQLENQAKKPQRPSQLASANGGNIGQEAGSSPGLPHEASESQSSLLSRLTQFPTVTTSPYIGLQSTYDGSDLVVNVSSMAEDLRLLRQKKALAKKLGGDLSVLDKRPVLMLSGKLEPTISTRRASDNSYRRSDIDLEGTELDFLVDVSSNAFGFFSLAHNNRAFDNSLLNSPVGYRVSNSAIYLKRGFITLGNLDKYPFYLSAGQMYTDFGRYTTSMITSTMPSRLGRTNARQIHLGYVFPMGLSASIYVFRGDTGIGTRNIFIRGLDSDQSKVIKTRTRVLKNSEVNEGGINLRYKKDLEDGGVEIGAGYISNIADSEGMQFTRSARPRQGFGLTEEFLFHRVPALNTYAEIKKQNWKFVAEYVGAVRSFDVRNLTFNDIGAKPKAMQLEASRKFDLYGKPSLLGFVYERSWESFALGLPENAYSLVFSLFPLKNIRFTLEYRYSDDYRAGSRGFISGSVPTNGKAFILPEPFYSRGGHANSLIAQLGLYF